MRNIPGNNADDMRRHLMHNAKTLMNNDLINTGINAIPCKCCDNPLLPCIKTQTPTFFANEENDLRGHTMYTLIRH